MLRSSQIELLNKIVGLFERDNNWLEIDNKVRSIKDDAIIFKFIKDFNRPDIGPEFIYETIMNRPFKVLISSQSVIKLLFLN